jgi:hypothetical protein
MAKRMFENPSTVSNKSLAREYHQNNKYCRQISKVKKNQPVLNGRRFSQLPPIKH